MYIWDIGCTRIFLMNARVGFKFGILEVFFSQWLVKSLKKTHTQVAVMDVNYWTHDLTIPFLCSSSPLTKTNPCLCGGGGGWSWDARQVIPRGLEGGSPRVENPRVSPFSHSHEDHLLMVTRSSTKDVGRGWKNKHHKGTCLNEIKTCFQIF